MVNFREAINNNYVYISDAGFNWNIISNPENNDRDKSQQDILIDGFDEMLNIIEINNHSFIISTHPHRFASNKMIAVFRKLFFQIIRKIVNLLRRIKFINSIFSRFYFIAKKL